MALTNHLDLKYQNHIFIIIHLFFLSTILLNIFQLKHFVFIISFIYITYILSCFISIFMSKHIFLYTKKHCVLTIKIISTQHFYFCVGSITFPINITSSVLLFFIIYANGLFNFTVFVL